MVPPRTETEIRVAHRANHEVLSPIDLLSRLCFIRFPTGWIFVLLQAWRASVRKAGRQDAGKRTEHNREAQEQSEKSNMEVGMTGLDQSCAKGCFRDASQCQCEKL